MKPSGTLLSELAKRVARGVSLLKKEGPSREEVLDAINEHGKKYKGLRHGWQADAAAWVKKTHVPRGDVKVGLHTNDGRFVILDSLRPRYVVPDLTDCKLKPYVTHHDKAKVLAALQKAETDAAVASASSASS